MGMTEELLDQKIAMMRAIYLAIEELREAHDTTTDWRTRSGIRRAVQMLEAAR